MRYPTVRASLAVALGFFLTSIVGLFTLIGGLPYRLLIDPWARRLWENPFVHMPRIWSALLHELCLRRLLRARIIVQGSIPKSKFSICISNHPSDFDVASLVHSIARSVHPRIVAVTKREHLRNPIFGGAIWVIGAGMFIDRANRSAAIKSLKAGAIDLPRRGAALVIFPDTRRSTFSRIRRDRKKFADKIPGSSLWLRRTLMPRSGGLFTLLQGIPYPFRVYNFTVSLQRTRGEARGIARLVGATLYLKASDVTDTIPRTEAELQLWLVQEWKRKNQLIDRWAGNSLADSGKLSVIPTHEA